MAKATVTISFRWWFKPYVLTLVLFCRIFQTEPDWDKVRRVINRATVVKRSRK